MEKYQRLNLDQREMIGQLLSQRKSLRFIANVSIPKKRTVKSSSIFIKFNQS